MLIRPLDRETDFARTRALCQSAQDDLALAYGGPPGDAAVTEFFTESPPGIAPATMLHFGLFVGQRLAGIANLAFGFPEQDDAYIGLMLLTPADRGQGLGPKLLAHLEAAARQRGARRMLLAVRAANPRGRAFWQRMGFADTGASGQRQAGPHTHTLVRLARPL